MALTEPTIDCHAFFTSSPTRSDNALGELDEAVLRWAQLAIKGTAKERVAQLLSIVKLCKDWMDNDFERARHHGANKSAVKTLMETAWRRVEWEHYKNTKQGGSKPNLKPLQGYHQHEANVMNKQEYKNEHVGINSIDQILSGWSNDRSTNTPLDGATKTSIQNFLTAENIPAKKIDVSKLTFAQYQKIEAFIIQSGIDDQFRQQYFSVDERISRMLIPDKKRHIWYYKPGEPFDTATDFTMGQALYVVDQYGNWYVDDGKPGVVNHSSICRGQPILCGGVLEARQGRLTTIINNSGHYCPDRFQFAQALKTVENVFSNWETIEVTVTRGGSDNVTFGGAGAGPRVSPVKFMRNPNHAGNGGKTFAGW